jgi:sortase A
MSTPRADRIVRWIERGLAATGIACLIWAATVSMSAVAYQSRQRALLERSFPFVGTLEMNRLPDAVVRPAELGGSIGRLEIPRIGVSAVVAEGDDENTLKVAVGHLPDTPLPWQEGNAALAGHRDTFFRPLGRIRVGDDIRLATPRGDFRYRVVRHTVVDPEDVWVLDASSGAALTLITCYPFDFVGPAPRRFIVHATRIPDAGRASQTSAFRGGSWTATTRS